MELRMSTVYLICKLIDENINEIKIIIINPHQHK